MGVLQRYVINFGNLKQGVHNYSFEIDNSFFVDYPFSLVDKASVLVDLSLERQSETLLILNFKLKGKLVLTCDYCLEEFDYNIEASPQLIVKLSDKEFENTEDEPEDILYLPLLSYELDIQPVLYEYLNFEVPMRRKCDMGGRECNPEMLKLIKANSSEIEDTNEDKDDIDPRWDALKNINKN